MPIKSFREAINEAIRQEMQADPTVILIGEDIAGGHGGIPGSEGSTGSMFGVLKGFTTNLGQSGSLIHRSRKARS